MPDWQQPVGQLVASQTQLPPLQCWPGEHAGRVPHLQPPLPVVPQLSAVTGLQPTHAEPLRPHAVIVGGEVQVLPEQQPLAQLLLVQAPLHTPAVQVLAQDAHCSPPVQSLVSVHCGRAEWSGSQSRTCRLSTTIGATQTSFGLAQVPVQVA